MDHLDHLDPKDPQDPQEGMVTQAHLDLQVKMGGRMVMLEGQNVMLLPENQS